MTDDELPAAARARERMTELRETVRAAQAAQRAAPPDDPLRTLLEVLAAQADALSAAMDRIADEAYLATARDRDDDLED